MSGAMRKSAGWFRYQCGLHPAKKVVLMVPSAIHLIQPILFRLLSNPTPILAIFDFNGIAEDAGCSWDCHRIPK